MNPGPHAWAASTWTMDPSPQLKFLITNSTKIHLNSYSSIQGIFTEVTVGDSWHRRRTMQGKCSEGLPCSGTVEGVSHAGSWDLNTLIREHSMCPCVQPLPSSLCLVSFQPSHHDFLPLTSSLLWFWILNFLSSDAFHPSLTFPSTLADIIIFTLWL